MIGLIHRMIQYMNGTGGGGREIPERWKRRNQTSHRTITTLRFRRKKWRITRYKVRSRQSRGTPAGFSAKYA